MLVATNVNLTHAGLERYDRLDRHDAKVQHKRRIGICELDVVI
jgi:hypothetical protein